jgi:hypothetical protein
LISSERWFVIFTAYLDEADTHGPAPTVILAGFLGTATSEYRQAARAIAQ